MEALTVLARVCVSWGLDLHLFLFRHQVAVVKRWWQQSQEHWMYLQWAAWFCSQLVSVLQESLLEVAANLYLQSLHQWHL